jgi:hypothetical protein
VVKPGIECTTIITIKVTITLIDIKVVLISTGNSLSTNINKDTMGEPSPILIANITKEVPISLSLAIKK